MKKLIPMLALILAATISNAQSQGINHNDLKPANTFRFLDPAFNSNHATIISNEELPSENAMATLLCLNISRDLKQQHHLSTKSFQFARGGENPYKTRNIGIGFLIGGAVNAGVGAYYIYSFESDPAYWDIDIFFAEIIGAGAIVVGGASILGGTIATIIGSVHGYKYARSNLKFKSDAKSFGLAYNF